MAHAKQQLIVNSSRTRKTMVPFNGPQVHPSPPTVRENTL